MAQPAPTSSASGVKQCPALDEEMQELEQKLCDARRRRIILIDKEPSCTQSNLSPDIYPHQHDRSFHNLLVLSDSAFPVGSFAFSLGLESYMAHLPRSAQARGLEAFKSFLTLSLSSTATTSLPYVTSAYRDPNMLWRFDNDLDASASCTVARRASIVQGRALLTIWDRSLKMHLTSDPSASQRALQGFAEQCRASGPQQEISNGFGFGIAGHLPPLFGALGSAMNLSLQDTLYLYLLGHCKTLLSAAVRASLFGPYQSQGLLVSEWLRSSIELTIRDEGTCPRSTHEAAQSTPVLDLWLGRHELLYSRIFNS